jgi:hypothetical protein
VLSNAIVEVWLDTLDHGKQQTDAHLENIDIVSNEHTADDDRFDAKADRLFYSADFSGPILA